MARPVPTHLGITVRLHYSEGEWKEDIIRNDACLVMLGIAITAGASTGLCANTTMAQAAHLRPVQRQAPSYPAAAPESMAARQQAFVARIMAASRPSSVILDARMNRNNELGVVLSPRVRLRDVRPLMTSLLRQMRRTLPGRRLTVITYALNGKPMATMRYDPYAPPDSNVIYRPNF